jgi:hypothetical protein
VEPSSVVVGSGSVGKLSRMMRPWSESSSSWTQRHLLSIVTLLSASLSPDHFTSRRLAIRWCSFPEVGMHYANENERRRTSERFGLFRLLSVSISDRDV